MDLSPFVLADTILNLFAFGWYHEFEINFEKGRYAQMEWFLPGIIDHHTP